jgi:hypothetical protein
MGIVLIFFFIITLTYLIQYDLIDSVCVPSELDFVLRFERNPKSSQLEIVSRSTTKSSSILKLSESSRSTVSTVDVSKITGDGSHVNKSYTKNEDKSDVSLDDKSDSSFSSAKSCYVSSKETSPVGNKAVIMVSPDDLKPEIC